MNLFLNEKQKSWMLMRLGGSTSFHFVSYATPSTEHSAHKLHKLTNNTSKSHLTLSQLMCEEEMATRAVCDRVA